MLLNRGHSTISMSIEFNTSLDVNTHKTHMVGSEYVVQAGII